jgi:hypothetical protein
MTPSIDERLASVIRALTDVILPSLTPEAALAAEQAHLSIGQLQIIRAQIDAAPAFEAEELEDARSLAAALAGSISGGPATAAALAGIGSALAGTGSVREARTAINGSVAVLVRAVATDGDKGMRERLSETIVALQQPRIAKDRQWFAPFGFDVSEAGR